MSGRSAEKRRVLASEAGMLEPAVIKPLEAQEGMASWAPGASKKDGATCIAGQSVAVFAYSDMRLDRACAGSVPRGQIHTPSAPFPCL